jgi:hypothetical protein
VVWRTPETSSLGLSLGRGLRKSKNIGRKEIIVTPEQWISKSKTFKHLHKLISREVEFKEQSLNGICPYCYGLWVGDGTTMHVALTTADEECVSAWCKEAIEHGLSIRDVHRPNNKSATISLSNAHKPSTWLSLVKRSGNPKRISKEFLINSKENRLQLLAGIIDSDGYNNNNMVYDVVTKYENLAKDYQFLARSLGFRATLKTTRKKSQNSDYNTYYNVCICGDLAKIPVRLPRKNITHTANRVNPLATGFRVEKIGEGDYYGFELFEDDKKYLMGNFMVTHNTTLIKNTLRAYPDVKTLVIAPGVDLISQLYEDIKEALPDRNVVMVGGDSKVRSQGDDITVCSSDSLDKCNTDTRLILADEPHTTVTDSRYPEIKKFETARKLAFGATLTGRFDNKDRLINGLFGEVLAERTFQEAVAEGAICPIECLLIQQDIGKTFIPLRNVAYKKLLFQNPTIAGITEHVLEKFVPKDYQTLMFIKNEKQAEYFQDFLTCKPAIAMAKKLNKKTRKAMMDSMASGEIHRCLASDIYAQGVTFSDLRCVINLAGGGPYTNSIQKPGRLAEIRPNKKCGILIDFIFTSSSGLNFKNAASSLVYDSVERLKVYSKKGYGIHLATNQKQIEEFFEKFL